MSGQRYPEEFQIESVNKLLTVAILFPACATRLDITTHSLYA